ncbi:MAG: large subunit ribosomal protein [Candidatus Poribacteria bacterium]|nr:large subunit ribosomal protein [Candidatus Poribacteria bacterium]
MRLSEIKQLTTEELKTRVTDSRDNLFRLRFQLNSGQLTDYMKIRQSKREIAQFMTIIRERELKG